MSVVRATLQFAVPGEGIRVVATHGPGGRLRSYEGELEAHEVEIRPCEGATLAREGFARVACPTAVRDFADEAELDAVYAPEVKALVKRVTGAARVELFDRTRRSGDDAEREAAQLREPVRIAHNDYTDTSGPDRLRHALPDEAEALLARRFAIVQVWRPTHEPIARDPLTLCEAGSVSGGGMRPLPPDRRSRLGRSPHLTRSRAWKLRQYLPHLQSAARISSSASGATPIASARSTSSLTTRRSAGAGSPSSGATRPSCSWCTTATRPASG